MGMNLSASNLFQFLSYISPFLLAFTFILIGFMNSEPLKPLIYIGCLTITMGLVVGLLKFNSKGMPSSSPVCSMWNILEDGYYRPSMSTYFITFTLFYIMLPMFFSGNPNYFLITFILFILASDTVNKYILNKCINFNGLMVAIVTGIMFGSVTAFGLYQINSELVFFGDYTSNKESCAKKSNKKFVCNVYKNGELIKQM